MTEKETFAYIEYLNGLGIRPGLESMKELCRRLGDPQKELKAVHIAGTNGKGSVLAMIGAALVENGIRTGCYASPTISDYRERFVINGRMISKKKLAAYVGRLKEVCEQMTAEGFDQPTAFEFETALAFLYFKEQACEIAIVETGMGGAKDATNVIPAPLLSVITSVGMDHMQFLGGELSEIAREKAGIIKPGCPVVTANREEAVISVIRDVCREKGAPLVLADEREMKVKSRSLSGIRFSYREYRDVKLSLCGEYQLVNGAVALSALSLLQKQAFGSLRQEGIRAAFAGLSWPGRFERIAKNPDFFLDGAHNEAAAESFRRTVEFYFTNKRIIYIMGVLKDKEYEKIIRETCEAADCIITVKPPGSKRALDAYELAKTAARYHRNVTAADSLEEAAEIAYLMAADGTKAAKDTVIIAFGSLSYLGRLKEMIQNGKWTRRDSHGR